PLFVAREDAMSCLRGLWADAERGRGGLVLVTGPAGVGRTRLAAELAHHAHARGAVVHLRSGPAQADGGPSQPGSIVEAAAGRAGRASGARGPGGAGGGGGAAGGGGRPRRRRGRAAASWRAAARRAPMAGGSGWSWGRLPPGGWLCRPGGPPMPRSSSAAIWG